MSQRTLILAILRLATVSPCRAASLTAQLFPLTGEVRLSNTSAVAVPFVFYSISSPSGALNGSSLVWRSITDFYDASGNGFIDPTSNWSKLSTVSTQLAEGVFSGAGGSLAAFRSVSLGQIWNPTLYPSSDLTFAIAQSDASPVTVTTQFAIAGDYNFDGVVNQSDYLTWRQSFGSTTNLNADGDLDGVVDAADYVVWRNNFGQSLPGAGSQIGGGTSLQVGSAVPEPTSAILLAAAAGTMLTARVRAPRAARFASSRWSARQ